MREGKREREREREREGNGTREREERRIEREDTLGKQVKRGLYICIGLYPSANVQCFGILK